MYNTEVGIFLRGYLMNNLSDLNSLIFLIYRAYQTRKLSTMVPIDFINKQFIKLQHFISNRIMH